MRAGGPQQAARTKINSDLGTGGSDFIIAVSGT